MRKVIVLLLFVFAPMVCQAVTIKICEDGAEWPPFTYYKRENGQKTLKIDGYSLDVINVIFKDLPNFKYTIKLQPWKFCLHAVKTGNYDMILSASYSEQRDKDYILTVPYYHLQQGVVYLKKHYPQGIKFDRPLDLLNYKVCGLLGYNYAALGVPKAKIDQKSKTFKQAFKKLSANRCDLVVATYTILKGFDFIGKGVLTPDFGFERLSWVKPRPFMMMISRKSPYKAVLQSKIDLGIERLEASGELKRLLKKYTQ